MSKTVAEAPLTTRAARAKLPAGLHWRSLDAQTHLGFRKGLRAGRWLVRWRHGAGYRQAPLGAADDVIEADGATTLNFEQARQAARKYVEAARATAAAEAAGPIRTVRSAIESYLDEREERETQRAGGRPLKKDARSRLTKHVLSDGQIADKPLHEITDVDLRDWRSRLNGLAATSVRRLVNDLKAALNLAADTNPAAAPALPGAIKLAFKSKVATGTVSRDMQIPSDGEVRALVLAAKAIDGEDGWEGDLHRLVLLLAATGARFGQVAALRVGDVQRGDMRLMLPVSAKGRGEKQVSHQPVPIGEDVLTALRPAIAGRKSAEPLLERWRMRQVEQTKWIKDRRGPWQSASEMTRPWAKIVARAEMPADTVPYCLRHASIVRGLRARLPTRLVAQLHDTSTGMIERHYSRYITDALADAVRAAVISLDEGAQVSHLRSVVG